jgi:hypothetical protein
MKLIAGLLLLFSAPIFFGGIDDMPVNHIQVIGSHNSYKQLIDPALFGMIKKLIHRWPDILIIVIFPYLISFQWGCKISK